MTVTVTVTYVSTYFGETPEGTGQAEDYRLKLLNYHPLKCLYSVCLVSVDISIIK